MKYKFSIPYIIGAMSLCGIPSINTARAAQDTDPTQDGAPTHLAYAKHMPIYETSTFMQETDFRPMQAVSHRKDVLYILNNGDTITRQGGTRAWRNNNPGNLRYGKFARENGSIGECGGFAVFPDEVQGMNALYNLLLSDSYRNLTIRAAINKYAPPPQNNVHLYIRKLCKQTGLTANTKLGLLSPEQLMYVAQSIRKIEGWVEGTEDTTHAAKKSAVLTQEQILLFCAQQDSIIQQYNARTM